MRLPESDRSRAGVKVQKTEFEVTSWLGDLVKAGVYVRRRSCHRYWLGASHVAGQSLLAGTLTSKEVMELAPPNRTVVDALEGYVGRLSAVYQQF
ncbi:hypothetical protein B0J14DRAFT_159585 [Halenospora varia]|nr:hypothetical protein B0J14DRAFT_159585 [Halenospora varia]